MKAYVYDSVAALTDQWHDGGGALVVTDGDPVEALREATGLESIPDAPVVVYDVVPTEPRVFIFPDAGGC